MVFWYHPPGYLWRYAQFKSQKSYRRDMSRLYKSQKSKNGTLSDKQDHLIICYETSFQGFKSNTPVTSKSFTLRVIKYKP